MKKSELRQMIREELQTIVNVHEGWGTLKAFHGLFTKLRRNDAVLTQLAHFRPTEQIAWLEKTYDLSNDEAKSMRKHLEPYISQAKAKIPIEL